MRMDIANDVSVVQSLLPASRTTTVNGTGADLKDYSAAVVIIDTGTTGGTTPSFTFQVEESDDNSSYAAVANADLIGSEPVITGANDNAVYELGYLGSKRYVRVAISAASGTTPTLLCSACVVRGKPRYSPAA
jgi:hypothetical protein